MKFQYSNKIEVLKTDKAVGYQLASTNNNDIVELHLEADGQVPPHALQIDVTFYVISGQGKITIDNKEISAAKGDVIEVKKNLDRSWLNDSSETLSLLVIKEKG